MSNENQPINQEMEIPNEKESKTVLYYVVLILLLLVLLSGGIAGYLIFPFNQKISGAWVSEDGTMTLSSQGENWTLAIPNYQQTQGLTLIYTGNWQAAGVNKYDGDDINVQLKINKKAFSKEEIEKLKNNSELYKTLSQTEKELVLQYTKEGIEHIQSVSNLNNIIHITLENLHWNKEKEHLYLNSQYFSEERIQFSYQK